MGHPASRFGGMTANERLAVAVLMVEWDAAINHRDRKAAIELLGRVELADQAENIVDTVLGEPEKYGFLGPR